MGFEFTKSRFLMCEGNDDKGFLEILIKARGLPEFQICRADECNTRGPDGSGIGGRTGFEHSLGGFSPIKGYSAVQGILIVSDNDTAKSFAEVQQAFTRNGHTPAAVLMIPSSTQHGDLESLCLPEIHRVWPRAKDCVDIFMACTGSDKWKKNGSVNKTRARSAILGFHEEDPYRGIGHMFRSGFFDPGNDCFDEIAEFLRNFDIFTGIATTPASSPAAIQQLLPPAS
jgi:hypothetical protein